MTKPPIDRHQIIELLNDYFGEPVEGLAPIATGQIASAYTFTAGGEDYVVRFVTGAMAKSFAKDQFAHRRLSPAVPVPRILHVGTFNDLHYALSRKVPGVPLDDLADGEFQQVIPDLMEKLDAIHRADVGDTNGFGYFDEHGEALFPSWREFLLGISEEGYADGFYGSWHRYFDETFLERELFDYVYERMKALLKYCPEERYLLHADYAFGNVLAKDGKITAVLDWANAMYGDFLYDVAWVDIGYEEIDFQSLFQRYYEDKNRPIPHYRERILCYQCYISLDSQIWYGYSGKQADYEWMRRRILGLLVEFQDSTCL